jgi:hypothetical protein
VAFLLKFKICKSVHYRTIQINHQPDAPVFQFIILKFVYSSTCFGGSRPSSGSQWLQWRPLVLPSYRDDSRAVFVVGPARPRTQHDCHHDTKVKPQAATGVIELLMMGGKTPDTCWAVNKRQVNKLENCCILMVVYLNWNDMPFLTSLDISKHSSTCKLSSRNRHIA